MNVIDYIDWRGDLTFEQAPFNAPDSFIFSMMIMVDFRGIVPDNGTISLYEAAKEFFLRNDADKLKLGLIISPEIIPMLKKIAVAPRSRDLRLTLFQTKRDDKSQFGAITVLHGKRAYVCFEGTDDTLAGWKEDFAMTFQCPVASQQMAVDYLKLVDAAICPDEIITCGHSKGGNLAVYSAAFAPKEVTDKIAAVYNHDGPGFPADIVADRRYLELLPKIRSFVPQNSIIGMLLERQDSFVVVKSTQKGVFQHDGFSWQVMRDKFVQMSGRTAESEIVGKTVRQFLSQMDGTEREQFTEALFEMLSVTNAQTLLELAESKNVLLKAMSSVAPETKEIVNKALRQLVAAGRRAAKEYASELTERNGARDDKNS